MKHLQELLDDFNTEQDLDNLYSELNTLLSGIGDKDDAKMQQLRSELKCADNICKSKRKQTRLIEALLKDLEENAAYTAGNSARIIAKSLREIFDDDSISKDVKYLLATKIEIRTQKVSQNRIGKYSQIYKIANEYLESNDFYILRSKDSYYSKDNTEKIGFRLKYVMEDYMSQTKTKTEIIDKINKELNLYIESCANLNLNTEIEYITMPTACPLALFNEYTLSMLKPINFIYIHYSIKDKRWMLDFENTDIKFEIPIIEKEERFSDEYKQKDKRIQLEFDDLSTDKLMNAIIDTAVAKREKKKRKDGDTDLYTLLSNIRLK